MKNQNIYKVRVKDVLVKDVVYVNPTDSLDETLNLMVENRVSALPVIDGHRRCVGFISATDLLDLTRELGDELNALEPVTGLTRQLLTEKLGESGLMNRQVKELMSDAVFSVALEDPLANAARELIRNRVHRLAVVDAQNQLKGIVSMTDILRAFAESSPE